MENTTISPTQQPDMVAQDLNYYSQQNRLLLYSQGRHAFEQHVWSEKLAAALALLEIIGTVGAIIILITMIRGRIFLITYRLYMSLIAIADIVLLFLLGGNYVIMTFTEKNPTYDVILQSDISCRAYHVVLGFTLHFTMWLHMALMIELFVMCVFPKMLNSVSSLERAHYLTLTLLTVLLIVNMNYFWTIKRQKEPLGLEPNELCYFDSGFEVFETEVYPIIDWTILGVVPLATWLGLMVFTARKYSSIGDRRPGGLLVSTSEYYKISYTVVTLYVVGHLPRMIWQISKFKSYWKESETNPGISTLQNFHTQLIDGNPQINLIFAFVIAIRFLVLIAASSAFRTQLKINIMKLSQCGKETEPVTVGQTISKGVGMAHKASAPLISKSESVFSNTVGIENFHQPC